MPDTDKLVEAWVTLTELYPSTIDGTLIDRRFDTPTALSEAKCVIEQALERELGPGYWRTLFAAEDSRKASAHE